MSIVRSTGNDSISERSDQQRGIRHGNGDFRGRALGCLGGLYKTHDAGIDEKCSVPDEMDLSDISGFAYSSGKSVLSLFGFLEIF